MSTRVGSGEQESERCQRSAPLLSVVIVTYHSVKSCCTDLERVVRYCESRKNVNLLIVDNSCDDAEAAALRLLAGEGAQVLVAGTNLGFAGGCNVGVKAAGGEWVLLLNPDVTVEAKAFDALIDAVGLLGSDVFSAAGVLCKNGVQYQGIAMLWAVWFADRVRGRGRTLIGPSGGFGVFRRSEYLELGGLNEDYFAWGEDCEFALRARRHGLRTVGIPVEFSHQGGHSVQSLPVARMRAYSLARNRVRISRTYYDLPHRLLFWLTVLALSPARLIQNVRRATCRADMLGFVDGFLGSSFGRPYQWRSEG